ncbi:MAG: transcription antitermination factor NusB [Pseudomonadota bacterium]|nr:transcription antitermination factor NusB [Pseudomonadota bacterium]
MARSGRHLARRSAVQALYQWEITGQTPDEIEDSFIANQALKDRHLDYFRRMIHEIPEHVEEIDASLAPFLDRPLSKVDPVERAILRVGAYELAYQRDIPEKVVLDEAIGLAKLFCAEHGYKFVNGVLDKLVNTPA